MNADGVRVVAEDCPSDGSISWDVMAFAKAPSVGLRLKVRISVVNLLHRESIKNAVNCEVHRFARSGSGICAFIFVLFFCFLQEKHPPPLQ